MTAAPVACADPTSLISIVQGSVASQSVDSVQGATLAAPYPDVMARFMQTGASEVLLSTGNSGTDLASGDVVWQKDGSYDAGDTTSASANDYDPVNGATFSVEFFAEPAAPTSYSGVISSGEDEESQLYFLTPGVAPYVANVSVSGGAVQVSADDTSQIFESPGQLSLGTITGGSGEINVLPEDGPQTQWTISITPVPITLSSTKFASAWSQPGVVNTLSFTADGDTHLTTQIVNASGTVVRTLATGLAESDGAHTLVWDGRDSSGNPVPTGTYTADLTSDDPVGNVTTATTTIGIDSTPPTVVLAQNTVRPSQAVIVKFADQGSGVASGQITVDRTHKEVLRSGETSLSYGPQEWSPGEHRVVAVATDRAGNRTTRSLSFDVRGNPTMPIRTGLTGPTRVRPGIVGLSVDDSGLLGGITGRHPTERTRGNPFGRLSWTTWNQTVGIAHGAEWINDCRPSCGQGVYRAYRATVRVYDLSSTGVFRRMTITTRRHRRRTYRAYSADGRWGWN